MNSWRLCNVRGVAVAILAGVLVAGLLSLMPSPAAAFAPEQGNDLLCTTIANPDGTYVVAVTLIEGYRFPLHLRRDASNGGSTWVRTVQEDQFGTEDGFPQDLGQGDGYFIRYRRNGAVHDVACFEGDLPQAPECSVEPWSVGSDAFWSVFATSQDGNQDFTLFINGDEISSNDSPYTNGNGDTNAWFDIARFATPRLDIEVAPTAAKFRRSSCGAVQQDLVGPGACDVTASENDPGRVWIELDVDFPTNFTVVRNGADIGEAQPVKFADFPLSYLVPNDYYEVVGSVADTYELRHGGIGVVCTGITEPPPPDGFVCTQDGDTLTWTDQGADSGRYHVRLDQGSSTKWESTVTATSATIDQPNGRYLIRWRIGGDVVNRFCP